MKLPLHWKWFSALVVLLAVKHIVKAHGGRAWAESTLDQGSIFHLKPDRAAEIRV